MSDDAVPFWNTNIPPEEWTEECPDYLSGVDAFDQKQLRVKDSDYRLMPWSEVTDLVREYRSYRILYLRHHCADIRRYKEQITSSCSKEYPQSCGDTENTLRASKTTMDQ